MVFSLNLYENRMAPIEEWHHRKVRYLPLSGGRMQQNLRKKSLSGDSLGIRV